MKSYETQSEFRGDPAVGDRGESGPFAPRVIAPSPGMLNRIAWSNRWHDRRRSRAFAEEALANAGRNRLQRGLGLRTLAWQARWGDSLATALDLADRALEDLHAARATAAAAGCHAVIAAIQSWRGRFDLARAALDAAKDSIAPDDGTEVHVELLTSEAIFQCYLGQVANALQSLAQASHVASGPEKARIFHNIARTHLHDNEPEAAGIYALRSVTLAKRHENRVIYPYALEVLGASHRAAGRTQRARASFETGLRAARAEGDRRAECQSLLEAGMLALASYDAAHAIELLAAGRALSEELGHEIWRVKFCRELARAYEMSGDLMGALSAMRTVDSLVCGMRV